MTPPVLLTPLDTDPLNVDSAKRNVGLPPFGITTHPPRSFASIDTVPISISIPISASNSSDSECDAYVPAASTTNLDSNRALANPRHWTGAPIRAIVPLPRRSKLVFPNLGLDDPSRSAHPNPAVGARRCLTRTPHFFDTIEDEDEEEEDGYEVGGQANLDGQDASSARYCSYQSISAAEGLAAWSFEELRVECYAQSFVARGTKPPPVTQPSLAIPPAFIPRIVPQS